MRITPKELAEKLADAYDDSSQGFRCAEDEEDFLRVARRAAELLGVPLAPEKIEPGTWHLTRSEGWPAYVDTDGHLFIIGPNGYLDMYMSGTKDWPALTPARVVPEDEWQEWQSIPKWERDLLLKGERPEAPDKPSVLTEDEVGALFDKVHEQMDHQLSKWGGKVAEFRDIVTATVNAALDKHGNAQHAPVKTPVLTEEDVLDVWQDSASTYYWDSMPYSYGLMASHIKNDILMFAQALINKYGATREPN